MPGRTVTDAYAPGSRPAGEEVLCRITAEGTTEQDVAIRAAVTSIEGIETEAPHLETGLENVLATGNRQAIVKLNDGVGEVLVYYRLPMLLSVPLPLRRTCLRQSPVTEGQAR